MRSIYIRPLHQLTKSFKFFQFFKKFLKKMPFFIQSVPHSFQTGDFLKEIIDICNEIPLAEHWTNQRTTFFFHDDFPRQKNIQIALRSIIGRLVAFVQNGDRVSIFRTTLLTVRWNYANEATGGQYVGSERGHAHLSPCDRTDEANSTIVATSAPFGGARSRQVACPAFQWEIIQMTSHRPQDFVRIPPNAHH